MLYLSASLLGLSLAYNSSTSSSSDGYWLEKYKTEFLIDPFDSGYESEDGDPYQWKFRVGELELESGSISGSFDPEIDKYEGRYENILQFEEFDIDVVSTEDDGDDGWHNGDWGDEYNLFEKIYQKGIILINYLIINNNY